MDDRLIPLNGLIALLRGEGGWPGLLRDQGFLRHQLEVPISTPFGDFRADALIYRRQPDLILLCESKSGRNIEEQQARRYDAADIGWVRRAGAIPPELMGPSNALDGYEAYVHALEATYRLGTPATEKMGMTVEGMVATIEFPHEVGDLDALVENLSSCKEPFRLWAVPREIRAGQWEANAVDLHVGHGLHLEVTSRWLRRTRAAACRRGRRIVRAVVDGADRLGGWRRRTCDQTPDRTLGLPPAAGPLIAR